MQTKYAICDKVWFLNTASAAFQCGEIKGIQIVPTGISKNEKGDNVLDGSVVLYTLMDDVRVCEQECFDSEEAGKRFYREKFSY